MNPGLWPLRGFPGGKESACSARDGGSIPGLERSPREENGNPLQNSCLENPMDRATFHGVAESDVTDSHLYFFLWPAGLTRYTHSPALAGM